MARGGRFKRGGGGSRGRGRGRGGGGGQRNFQDDRQSFDQVDKHNEKFERFYNTINIVPEGDERDAFWATLRKELPNSFRFTGSKGHARSVRDNLVNRYFPLIEKIEHDGQPVKLPTQMKWYPEGLAYRMDTPKNVVRKYEPFKEFQKFLVSETGVGNISRQEEVSMIPPMLLDVLPHHTVLDLCAAPGSKSAQLIELIHVGEEDRVQQALEQAKSKHPSNGLPADDAVIGDQGRATGMLVANDVNYQRAQMLVHQVKRLNSPNLIVTNHDATMFPSIEMPSDTLPGKKPRGKYLKFDRILADVPCAGDGTCRKNPSIWKEWTPQNAIGLYQTQVRILTRALQMLKVGGRVVYSTCSMNPVEDEAVVASAIERCGGVAKVRLVDCSDRLPGLVRSQGLKDWSVMNRGGQIYESWPEAEQYEGEGSRLVPGMFAPDAEEQIPLEHCWRVYPHQQDTGGFFIAALEKISDIRAKPENESKSGNRHWKFDKLDTAPTAFTEMLDEVANGRPEDATTVPEGAADSISAAQRQNSAENGTAGSPLKRPAPEDDADDAAAKKAKLNDGISHDERTDNAAGREHVPLPPSVEMAVEASGGQPGDRIAANDDKVHIPTEVKEAANEAPFEKTIPTESLAKQNAPKKRKDDPVNEEAFEYLEAGNAVLQSIFDFYQLHPSFPRDRFLVRNPAGDPVKGIYYTSQLVKDVLVKNKGRGMKFVHGGVKMFMKQDAQGQNVCRWRIQTEGLPILEGWVGDNRVVRLRKKNILRKLLIEMFPKLPTDKHADGTETGGWKDLGEVGEQIKDMGMGCCVLRVEPSSAGNEDDFKEPLTLPLWRSMHSVNLMLPKEDRKAMLLRIFNEDVELINHTDPKQHTRGGGQDGGGMKGSIPAEADAKEMDGKLKKDKGRAYDDQEVPEVDATSGLPANEAGAMALEQDAIGTADQIQSKRLEVLEDEDRKIAEAMPERAGEGDEYNTTV